MKHIKIPIPQKEDWKHWFEVLMFKIRGGFSCRFCGDKMQYKCFQIETKVHGKRLMLSNNRPCVCPSCAVRELTVKANVVFTEHDSKCDWCEDIKDTTSIPRDKSLYCNVHIGGRWWNGHHICADCLNEALLMPIRYTSGKHKQIGKRLYPINELGIPIKK